MIFMPTEYLSKGMIIVRELRYYDINGNKSITINSGTRITNGLLDKFKRVGIKGAYVDDTLDYLNNQNVMVSKKLKEETITGIKEIAEKLSINPSDITSHDIENLNGVVDQILGNLISNDDTLISINELKSYDDYTYHHSLSVSVLALTLGMELGLSKDKLYELGLSALLHDIGKTSIPIEIIGKPSRLTSEEFEIVKLHPTIASDRLEGNRLISTDTYSGIKFHHEKFNGYGYPYGLCGDKIPFFARILAVADVYDALTSIRPYRTPNSPNEGIEYVMAGAGSHFDEEIVSAFIHKISPYPVGCRVKFSNGETGVVIKNNKNQPLRPVVQVDRNPKMVYDLLNDIKYFNIVIIGEDKSTIAIQ